MKKQSKLDKKKRKLAHWDVVAIVDKIATTFTRSSVKQRDTTYFSSTQTEDLGVTANKKAQDHVSLDL